MPDYREIGCLLPIGEILPQIRKSLNEYYAGNQIWSLNYKLGHTVFEAYYSVLYKRDFKQVYSILNYCLQDIESIPYENVSLFNGISGLGWVLQHFHSMGLLSKQDIKDVLPQIDEIIANDLKNTQPSIDDLDLFYGLLGVSVYLLSKNKSIIKARLLEIILEKITLSIALISSTQKIDLGIPHGLSGTIITLTRFFRQGFDKRILKNNLNLCVDIILSNRLEKNSLSSFPTNTKSFKPSRLAWCYGDLSIVIALVNANKVLYSKILESEINILLKRSLSRELSESGVFLSSNNIDAGLCHGALGISYLLSKIRSETKTVGIDDRISYWMRESLSKIKIGEKFLNFKTPFHEETHMTWGFDGGLVDGLAGIGLMLVGLRSEKLRGWDSVFLLDLD